MGLTVCEECGRKVSKSASSCPHCGAPKKKKTSRLTWLVIILVALIVIGSFDDPEDSEKQDATPAPSQKDSKEPVTSSIKTKKTEIKKPSWRVHTSEDEMSGEKTVYAISPRTTSVKRMAFPYTGTKAWLGYGCSDGDEWFYIGFDEAPNLTNSEAKSGGYSTFSNRVRWDSKIEKESFSQEWGAKFIHFHDTDTTIQKVMNSSSMRLELNWHGEGAAHFDFNLDDSLKAISEARSRCDIK